MEIRLDARESRFQWISWDMKLSAEVVLFVCNLHSGHCFRLTVTFLRDSLIHPNGWPCEQGQTIGAGVLRFTRRGLERSPSGILQGVWGGRQVLTCVWQGRGRALLLCQIQGKICWRPGSWQAPLSFFGRCVLAEISKTQHRERNLSHRDIRDKIKQDLKTRPDMGNKCPVLEAWQHKKYLQKKWNS